MELHGKDISAGNRASKRRWIANGCRRHLRIIGHRVIAVREVKPRTVLDALPQWMGTLLPNGAPAHVRNFQPMALIDHRGVTKTHDMAGQHTQTGSGPFLAILKQHLQTQANAQEWP